MRKALQPKLTIALLAAALLLLNQQAAYTQATLQGKVWLQQKQPAVNASVALLKATDSSLVKATVGNKSGDYVFKNIPQGTYFIYISNVGYQPAYSSPLTVYETDGPLTVEALLLLEEPASMKQITVVAKKPFLEQKIDRLVINVAASITSSGNTALEVLERSPGVVVDHQNNLISMNGKGGVVLMMNGKISHTTISATMQLLQSMPAGNIEKIELITTPPANLDAEGNAGYINIVLKENNNYGTNGSISVTAGYGQGWTTQAALNMNHRVGRINVYGDISYSRAQSPFRINGYDITSNVGTKNETDFEGHRIQTIPNVNGRLGVDFELAKHTVAGLLFSAYDNRYLQSEHNQSSILTNGRLDTLIKHDNSEVNHWYNYAANVNLQHQFREAEKLLFNLDYIYYNNNQPVNYYSSYYNKASDFIYAQAFRSGKKTPIHFWVAALDYSKKLSKNISMEAGIKQTLSSFDNALSFERLLQNLWIRDESLSATYKLREDYGAAYATFNITLSKSTEAKAGLRYEHTNSNLGTATQKNIVDRHYGNLFPSVFITHKLTENSSIDFSYSRRITRPTFNALAPFTYYANANTLVTGNPALQPSVSDNFKAGYAFKRYFLSLSYSFDDHAISGFQAESDSVTNKVVIKPQNLLNQKTVSLVLSLPVTVTTGWTMQYNVTGLWQQAKALYKGDTVRVAQVNFTLNASQRFTLPKNFSIELSGYYQSPMLYGLGLSKANGSLDAGIKKILPGKGGTLAFSGSNILNTAFGSAYIDLPKQNLVSGIKIYFSQPTFKLTYQRSFGKEKLKATRTYSTGAEDEKGRVQ